jgi:hypothetical protein
MKIAPKKNKMKKIWGFELKGLVVNDIHVNTICDVKF